MSAGVLVDDDDVDDDDVDVDVDDDDDMDDDLIALKRLRAPVWTPFDQLLLARSDAQDADFAAQDQAYAAKRRAAQEANPNPGPAGWRIE